MLFSEDFFTLNSFAHASLFHAAKYAWEALKGLHPYLIDQHYPALSKKIILNEPLTTTFVLFEDEIFPAKGKGIRLIVGDATKGKLEVFRDDERLSGASVIMAGAVLCGEKIHLGKGILIESGAFIRGPVSIGDQSEVRQGAYIRGDCLIGNRCVVGHVTEVKHSILLDDAKAGHFAYLGDSIIGNRVNLGAGTKLANLKFQPGTICIRTLEGPLDTGMKKLGAILADDVQTGCNSVTNPGALVARRSMVMPNTTVSSGYHKEDSIIR